jgi:predicted Ser/Thr protein kinase
MSSKTDQREISFNEWAQTFQVSSKWDTESIERRQFMEKLELALEADRMGIKKEELPKVDHEPSLLGKFQGLVYSCLNLN